MISVLTCAKRGQYLEQTIASLERGGAAEYSGPKVLHVDGPADELVGRFPGWDVVSVSDVAGRGARFAMMEIFRRTAAAGVELLLYFEDDVVVCRNAIRAMIEIGVPEPLGFVSYCDLGWHGTGLELHQVPGCTRNYQPADQGFCGCQALAIPRRTLERVLERGVPTWVDRHNCDATMGTSSEAIGIFDSLADHVGKRSAILEAEYPRLRIVRGWVGEDFDAAELPRTYTLNPLGQRCPFHVGVLHPSERACPQSTPEHADPSLLGWARR